MLRIYADKYVALGRDFQELEMLADRHAAAKMMPGSVTTFSREESAIDDVDLQTLVDLLIAIERHCGEINLRVTQKIAETITADLSSLHVIPWSAVGARVSELRRCFMIELSTTLAYMITPTREPFYVDDASRFVAIETIAKFPSARFDLTEAGKCFATERFTASVSHLMKAAEYALVSFAAYAGIQGEERANWNKALNTIHTNIREKKTPFGKLTHAELTYFVELEGYLRAAKTAWRNPVSHVPIVFIEGQAKSLFEIVRVLLNFAAQKLAETPE